MTDVYNNVSIVIPTIRDDNPTADSAPSNAELIVRRDDGLNAARNRGIEEATNDWVVLVDDDITFPTELLRTLLDSMNKNHLLGLEDSWPLDYIIGRMMVFHRSLWERVGGFDESREHGGDTDFAIRCKKHGASILRLPRYVVPHHDEEQQLSTKEHAEWLFYLTRRHPLTMLLPALKLIVAKLGIVNRPRQSEDFNHKND